MKVFYRPEQVAENAASFSPSAGKPALVVADWLKHKLITEDDIETFEPVSRETLALAHDRAYVDGVLDLEVDNGFHNRDAQVAASLPYTTGSFLAAAEHAILYNTHTCSPTSGFHHAGYSRGHGFCTFNGLMVAAMALKQSGLIRNLAIIDCDAHYGDGTQDIIDTLGVDWIKHYTFGRHFECRADVGNGARKFYTWLDEVIDDCQGVSLVMYQAGADPHLRDPLGGMLSGTALIERDARIRTLRNPIVWNLAGGYQRHPSNGSISPVLDIHRNTARAFKGAK